MKVAPIIPNMYSKKSTAQNIQKHSYYPAFKADSFNASSFLDIALTDLENTIQDEINPFISKYKDKYRKIGFMGIELEAVMQELKKQGNEYFRSELNAKNRYDIFEQTRAETDDYSNYLMNIKEYEHLSEMAENPFYNKPEVQKKVEEIKPLIYADSTVFESRKKLFSAYKNAISNIDDTAGRLTIKQLPVYEKIKNAQNLYTSAVTAIMLLPVNDAVRFKTEAEKLINSNEKNHIKLDKAQKLVQQMYRGSLLESIRNANINEADIDKFLDENKNFKYEIPSVKEVKEAYKTLYAKREALLKSTSQVLEKFYEKAMQEPYNKAQAEKIINTQKSANEELWKIIQNIKSDYISRQNEKFMQNYE